MNMYARPLIRSAPVGAKIGPAWPLTTENGLVYYASLPVDAVPDSREEPS